MPCCRRKRNSRDWNFNVDKEKIKAIMDEDPGVKNDVFVYDILAVKSFQAMRWPDQLQTIQKFQ